MLVAILAVVLLISLAAALAVLSMPRQPERLMVGRIVVVSTLALSVAVLGGYLIIASIRRWWLVLPIVVALAVVPDTWWDRIESLDALWAAPACVLLWTAFALGYLRARPMRPLFAPPPETVLKLDDRLIRSLPEDIDADAAASIWLTEKARRPASMILWLLVLLLVTFTLASMLSNPVPLAYALTVIGPSSLPWSANQAARRARKLWLRSGLTRTALFRRTEREVLLESAWLGLWTLAWIAAMALRWPEVRQALPWFLALSLGWGLNAVYIGLMAVRGFGPAAVLAAAVAATPLLLVLAQILFTGSVDAQLAATALVVQLGLALLYRETAMRRWRRIDWLRFRPVAHWPVLTTSAQRR
jgi:hypothetical protein